MQLGEIYSLACDGQYAITGHTLTNSAFKIWNMDNLEEVKVIKVVAGLSYQPCISLSLGGLQ